MSRIWIATARRRLMVNHDCRLARPARRTADPTATKTMPTSWNQETGAAAAARTRGAADARKPCRRAAQPHRTCRPRPGVQGPLQPQAQNEIYRQFHPPSPPGLVSTCFRILAGNRSGASARYSTVSQFLSAACSTPCRASAWRLI